MVLVYDVESGCNSRASMPQSSLESVLLFVSRRLWVLCGLRTRSPRQLQAMLARLSSEVASSLSRVMNNRHRCPAELLAGLDFALADIAMMRVAQVFT